MHTLPTHTRDSLIGSYINTHDTGYPDAVHAVDHALAHGADSPHATAVGEALTPLFREQLATAKRAFRFLIAQQEAAVSDDTAPPQADIVTRIDRDLEWWEFQAMHWHPGAR